MNSNEKYLEILDEYGTWKNYTIHKFPKTYLNEQCETWEELIRNILYTTESDSMAEVLEILRNKYSVPIRLKD